MFLTREYQFSRKPYTVIAPPKDLAQQLPDLRILESLATLYREQSQIPGFPRLMCVGVVGKALGLGMGLQMIDGKFCLDRSSRRAKLQEKEPHAWLVDHQGRYYELTGEQFNAGLETKFAPGVTVICPGTELYQKYITREQLVREIA